MEPLGELRNGRSVDSPRVKVRNLYGVRQFVRPNGRQRQEVIENMPNDLKSHLDAIKKAGCRLTAEVTFNNVSALSAGKPRMILTWRFARMARCQWPSRRARRS